MRNNGSLIGNINVPNSSNASGIWDLENNYDSMFVDPGSWPHPLPAIFKSSAIGTTTVTAPAGISAGDLLVYAVFSFGTAVPTGFTSVIRSGNGTLAYKIAVGTESGTSITASSVANSVLIVYNIFGKSITIPTAFSGANSDTLLPAQTISSRLASSLAIGVCGHSVGTSNPSDFTTEPPFLNKNTSPVNSTYGSYVTLGCRPYRYLPQLTVATADRGTNNFLLSGSFKIG